MAVTKRTRLSPEERRAQLIDLGARMLAERPLEQVSVEEIADQAGVSRGLLFHYFASKRDFHLAIVRHTNVEMLAHTEPDLSLEPLEILRSAITAYIDYVSENRNTYVSLLRGTASGDPEMRDEFERTRAIMA
jgi:AcrR family transcriptional regulator